ncbi:hypothetical protein RJ641_023859 [Dillenia turbinata]|uniref:Omega-hydroxypalmitate O-feruloyl transferase n=1 Tax=Dillenia turbinata TaxID=194707 RepID=A0AAN8UHD0_9MAGN
MGNVYQGEGGGAPDPITALIHDLKVTVHCSSLLFPPEQTERKCMFLSNIDQVLDLDVETVHFFRSHPDFPPEILPDKLKIAYQKLLVPYNFLAGRLKMNAEVGRLEIDCNDAGVGYVVASSEYALDEIGDLVYPNPAFRQLITQNPNFLGKDDRPLCVIQVTTFKCGGFVMGVSTNHTTFDGISFKHFLQNLAAVASGKPLFIPPCNQRELLSARSPPRVTFPHPELLKLKLPIGHNLRSPIPFGADTTAAANNGNGNGAPSPPLPALPPLPELEQEEQLDIKIFKLTPSQISHLKDKAKSANSKVRATGFNVVTALIWCCKALSCIQPNDVKDHITSDSSTILYAVDIRPRLNPPLPPSYTGNAVLTGYATATREELDGGAEWWRLVEMVSEGSTRMTNDYARSAIDWGELYRGFPHGDVLVSSWWRLGFADIEYPWGRPHYSCPVVYHRKDIILLFPNIVDDGDGAKAKDVDTGVNVLVALPPKEMEKFHSLFHKFLLP